MTMVMVEQLMIQQKRIINKHRQQLHMQLLPNRMMQQHNRPKLVVIKPLNMLLDQLEIMFNQNHR